MLVCVAAEWENWRERVGIKKLVGKQKCSSSLSDECWQVDTSSTGATTTQTPLSPLCHPQQTSTRHETALIAPQTLNCFLHANFFTGRLRKRFVSVTANLMWPNLTEMCVGILSFGWIVWCRLLGGWGTISCLFEALQWRHHWPSQLSSW